MKISVCIACYNGEKFLKEQLESIICQLRESDEIIISDDGSTDGTWQIIESFNDPRIRIFTNPFPDVPGQPPIYSATRNFGHALHQASGDLIFLSDQDDIWTENKVKTIHETFLKGKYDLIVHDASVIDENNKPLFDSWFLHCNSGKGFIKNILNNSYLGCCMAFNRKILMKSLPFPENLVAHDIWIGLTAEKYGKVVFINQKLISYRRHAGSTTPSGKKSPNSFCFKLKYRIQLSFQLLMN